MKRTRRSAEPYRALQPMPQLRHRVPESQPARTDSPRPRHRRSRISNSQSTSTMKHLASHSTHLSNRLRFTRTAQNRRSCDACWNIRSRRTDCGPNEQLKEYHLGRYVDARDPFVMHEGHPLYRVETSARWDLRPNDNDMHTVPRRRHVQAPSVSANDAVVAEVNKQRAATRAFTEQTADAQSAPDRTRPRCRTDPGSRKAEPRTQTRRSDFARTARRARFEAARAEARHVFTVTITGGQMVTRLSLYETPTTNLSSSPWHRPPSRGTRKRARRSSRGSALRPDPSSS